MGRKVKGRVVALESAESEAEENSMSLLAVEEGGEYQLHRVNLEAYQSQEEQWTHLLHSQNSIINSINLRKDMKTVLLGGEKDIQQFDI